MEYHNGIQFYCNIIMERSIYGCINHIKCVSKKRLTFEKILGSMSKSKDNLDADKLRKLFSGMTARAV